MRQRRMEGVAQMSGEAQGKAKMRDGTREGTSQMVDAGATGDRKEHGLSLYGVVESSSVSTVKNTQKRAATKLPSPPAAPHP